MTTPSKGLPGFLRRSIRTYDDATLDVNDGSNNGGVEERLGGGIGSSSLIPPSTSESSSSLGQDRVSASSSSSRNNEMGEMKSNSNDSSSSSNEKNNNTSSISTMNDDKMDGTTLENTKTVNPKFRLSPSTDVSDDSSLSDTPKNTDTSDTSNNNSNTTTTAAGSIVAGITSLTSYITSSSSITESSIHPSDSYLSNASNNSNNTTTQPKTYKELEFDKLVYPSTNNTNSSMGSTLLNISDLRRLAWNGIPSYHRPLIWKILLGYLPTNSSRRLTTLKRKRSEYKDAIAQHYDIPDHSRTSSEQETLRQVLVDVPRTAPDVALFRNEMVRSSLTRLLYIWAMRHPASSYVQGINDLATPLVLVFLSEHLDNQDILTNVSVLEDITEEIMDMVEADVYWCLTNLLANIQDHYTSDQPGVQRMVMRLEELVHRIDKDLATHLQSTGVEFMQFAFRWMNCLLLREFDLRSVVRLWDTYLSEGDGGFERFHVYVCAAFLCQFSVQLREMQFDELFGFMQNIPTSSWGDGEVEILLSQAYVLSTLFHGSDAHLISALAH